MGQEVKDILKTVLSDLKKKRKDADFEKAAEVWEKIVGPHAFACTKIVYLTKDRIRVNVGNSSQLYDLNLKKERIRRELKKALGIEDVRFVLGELS
ncbi:MAG: DUF721 domain-containing protein [Candidatus Omnitrophica bacterium]|nr:DUF721 domain-containing protein [Candidatus Omnitrophota bacterium]